MKLLKPSVVEDIPADELPARVSSVGRLNWLRARLGLKHRPLRGALLKRKRLSECVIDFEDTQVKVGQVLCGIEHAGIMYNQLTVLRECSEHAGAYVCKVLFLTKALTLKDAKDDKS